MYILYLQYTSNLTSLVEFFISVTVDAVEVLETVVSNNFVALLSTADFFKIFGLRDIVVDVLEFGFKIFD